MTPWTEAYQAPPSMGFPSQESWSGLPFPSPGDLPDLRILRWQVDSLSPSYQESPSLYLGNHNIIADLQDLRIFLFQPIFHITITVINHGPE